MKEAIIHFDHVSVGYNQSDIIHRDINLVINKGDYIGIIGENGAGKSTIVKTLTRLIPTCEGRVVGPRSIGYLPQETDMQLSFPGTCEEVVKSGFRGLFWNKKEKEKAEELIEKLGITPFRKKKFCEISGGQRKRVLLARALCVSDEILVLDEPLNGLDMEYQELMYKYIDEINKRGTTIVMISHDSRVYDYADFILEVKQGSVEFSTNNRKK